MALPITVSAAPPPTEQQPFTYTLHGETFEDPYLWLEGSDAPEIEAEDAELDARVSGGLQAVTQGGD